MSREKQIEKMTKVIASVPPITFPVGDRRQGRRIYAINKIAEAIYDAGICEPEWISVEERLPEEGVDVLVALKFHDHVSVDTDRTHSGRWLAYGEMRGIKYVTHWMPLPEAPKGGAE